MKFIKRLLLGAVYMLIGVLFITLVAMVFMFIAGNVGGIGGRTMSELHSDLIITEKNLVGIMTKYQVHRHQGIYGKIVKEINMKDKQ